MDMEPEVKLDFITDLQEEVFFLNQDLHSIAKEYDLPPEYVRRQFFLRLLKISGYYTGNMKDILRLDKEDEDDE